MFYDYALTIPAGTTEDAPLDELVGVSHGVLHRVEIAFPAGCAGLAHLVVLHWEFQIYPTNRGGSFAADDYTIPVDTHYELYYAPYELKIRAWNLDDTYDHTVTVRLGILPQKVAEHIFGKTSKKTLDGIRTALKLATRD